MTGAELLAAIGTVGFPIVMCLYMMKTNNTTIAKLSEIIAANTTAVTLLCSKMSEDRNV